MIAGIINRTEDSLFTYTQDTSFATFYDPNFIPTFSPSFSLPTIESEAHAMCGDDTFCLFDVAATGSTEIGLSTLQGNIEFDTIVNMSLPGEEYTIGPCLFS